MFSPAAKAMAERLGLRLGRPNLEVFAETLLELAQADRNILAVTSDSRGSGKLSPFGQSLPQQIIEVGIAEQNLVGVTAGLASAGKKAFGVSPACFLSARALEQIKNDVCYSDVPAVVVGISAGVSYGALGSTHHSLHDLAALRAIHNIKIVAPADNFETRAAVRAAAASECPVYLRFGKAAMYDLSPMAGGAPCPRPGVGMSEVSSSTATQSRGHGALNSGFELGRARTIRAGADLAFVAAGETVIHALLAAAQLADEGFDCRVLSMPTIKPLDVQAVIRAGRECRAIITVEEHSIHGGLGEACAAVLVQAGLAVPMRIVGIPDEDTVTGSQADIFRHYGITMEGLATKARGLLAPPAVEIRRADIESLVVQQLIAALNAELSQRYREPGANHFRLDPAEVAEGQGAFLVAYLGEQPVGCGAVRRNDAETAEIKRMYVDPALRGGGIARRVLDQLEIEGRRLGVRRLVLETGIRQVDAIALYHRAGYVEVPLFGEYLGSPLSVCMAKDL
jgi:transketolase